MEKGNQGNQTALDAIKAQREAFKNFYKLDTDQSPESKAGDTAQLKCEVEHQDGSDDIDPEKIADIDNFISTESYLNILKVENKVLESLNASKSEIKSIIYNNYYELIKINNVLEDLLEPKDDHLSSETITSNLSDIRMKLKKLKTLDLDIFGDSNCNPSADASS